MRRKEDAETMEGTWDYLLQADGSDLEPEDDDPKQTQDQCTISIYNVLWTNQIHTDLREDTDGTSKLSVDKASS